MSKNKNKRDRYKVYKRSNFSCTYCDRKFTPPKDWDLKTAIHDGEMYLEIDHIKPKAKGGSEIIGNKQSLCGTCNLLKSDYSEGAFYLRIIDKRNYYYNELFGICNRIYRFRKRGQVDYMERSLEHFKAMYPKYKHSQRVVVYLSKWHY